ncbi:hypothetical protein ACGFNV_45800 [Streptomyces sp. NPDC048751]|uniref:hypothetical protein n=1 Tax=Streptomyces sp. NPDC048751 TaxID=3365591 RepID=UPI003721A081
MTKKLARPTYVAFIQRCAARTVPLPPSWQVYASLFSSALNNFGTTASPGYGSSRPASAFNCLTAAATRAPYTPSMSPPS